MAVNARWRIDPQNGIYNPLFIANEEHTIQYYPEPNCYGFYLDESIQLRNPSTVVVVTDNTAATPFIEVPKTAAPSAGEFWVDYDAVNYLNTGLIKCNAADNGTAVLVSYHGLGTIDHPSFYKTRIFTYNGNVQITGDIFVDAPSILVPYTSGPLTVSFANQSRPIRYITTPISPSNLTVSGVPEASSVVLRFVSSADAVASLGLLWPQGINPSFLNGFTYIVNIININGSSYGSVVAF